ncbi:hypothetical protein GJ700_05230 [Duganella sp. FT92W]|uniref:Uncharacterized protein n=2 Tax=Pseudoduganella rivuli TaxID=2666085 RepID=A0A7X2IJT3_9BURK|nr:hypothetical protein [Pseudoduganella rivuli]
MDDEEEVTVDGVTYKVASLSEEARTQVNNLKFVEAEIAAMQSKVAVFTTAKIAYENALRQALPRATH